MGRYIYERYGELELAGRGELKSLLLPAHVFPDLIFKVAGEERYVVVEVKNTARIEREHRIQAAFYASLAPMGGLAVKYPLRLRGNSARLTPIHSIGGRLDILLVAPRLGRVERVEPLSLDWKEVVRKIWEAKILGMLGKQPQAPRSSYCRRCRWKNYCSHFNRTLKDEEATIDRVPRSPYLLFAKSMAELGVNPDVLWLYSYLRPITDTIRVGWVKRLYRLLRLRSSAAVLAEALSEQLEIDYEYARDLAALLQSREERADTEKRLTTHVGREFQEDLEEWSKIVGEPSEKIVRRLGFSLFSSLPRRIALPRGSLRLLEHAEKTWFL